MKKNSLPSSMILFADFKKGQETKQAALLKGSLFLCEEVNGL